MEIQSDAGSSNGSDENRSELNKSNKIRLYEELYHGNDVTNSSENGPILEHSNDNTDSNEENISKRTNPQIEASEAEENVQIVDLRVATDPIAEEEFIQDDQEMQEIVQDEQRPIDDWAHVMFFHDNNQYLCAMSCMIGEAPAVPESQQALEWYRFYHN